MGMNDVTVDPDPIERVVVQLRTLRDEQAGAAIRVDGLVDMLGADAHVLLILIASLPNCLPGPPGYGWFFGLVVLPIALRMSRGKPVALPAFIARRSLPVRLLTKLLERFQAAMGRSRRLIKPRWAWLTSPLASRLLGAYIVVLMVAVLVPLPFTNFLPALAAVLICLGLMARDGALVVVALFVGLAGLAVLALAVAAVVGLLIVAEEAVFEH